MDVFQTLFGDLIKLFLYINAALIIITIIFIRPRRVSSIYLWIAAFLILPLFFVLLFYVFFGRDYRHRKIFRNKGATDKKTLDHLKQQRATLFQCESEKSSLYENLSTVKMLLNDSQAIVTTDNEVIYYNDGKKKFDSMFNEIRKAKKYVHMEYYIIRNDELGKQLVRELATKAREGVEVKLLYDAVGCHQLSKKFFKELTDAGGKTAAFFPSFIRRINTRINNRNHRKILIIDGDCGFCGGFNIGIEYEGRGKLGPWRDDAVLVRGGGAIAMEARFILDWNFAAKDTLDIEKYFHETKGTGKAAMQIVSGGPDTEFNPIEQQYLKMISSAKESIYIQTPYFVPDEPVLSALRIAALSGAKVQLMIPCKPDHPFVYWATLFNAGSLLDAGIKVYKFDPGFIHAKICVVDDKVASVGSANFDVRSFELNFETNAMIYDADVAKTVREAFDEDVRTHSSELTKELYDKRSWGVKIKEAISRLYSPIA